MIKAVIFDIGGVLAYDVWENLLLSAEDGIASIYNLDKEQVQIVGENLWEQFAYRKLAGENGWQELEREYWELLVKRLDLPLSIEEYIQLTDKFICPIDGMSNLLELLQLKGIELAICSNNTEFWCRRQMDKLNLHQFFDPGRVILSSRVGFSKSSPGFEMFKAVVSALGVPKEFCVFVDDREESIERALQFGLTGIIFPSHSKYGYHYLITLLEKMNVL